MEHFPFISTLIMLPLLGALFIFLFIKGNAENAFKNIAAMGLWTSIIVFILSLVILFHFEPSFAGFQFIERYRWLGDYNISYHVGVDGISLFFIILTTFLTPLIIYFSYDSIKYRIKEYMIGFLLLESFVIGTFTALDMILFYFFFEIMLVPMFLIIGIWGGKDRVYAAFKFFLYTLFGSVFFLLALVYIYISTNTVDIVLLHEILPSLLTLEQQKILWIALFVAFAIKIPMCPFHTWLPDAHVQAPTAASVILAAVLLKIGAYGFLRFSIPMFPLASYVYSDMVMILSIIAIIYTSIVAFAQSDIKKLIAYSSVAHMGYVTLGIFAFNEQSIAGSIFQMLSHGIISGALFLCVGIVYSRLQTRNISELGGLVAYMPYYGIFFMVFTLGSIALPLTSGFVGEFLILVGVYAVSPIFSILASIGVVLGAVYMLFLAKNIIMGETINEKIKLVQDLNFREWLVLSPLAILVILLGIYPAIIFDPINITINDLLASFWNHHNEAIKMGVLDVK